MVGHGSAKLATLLALAFGCGLFAGETRAVVYRHVSSERLENILKDLDIAYQKTTGKKENIFVYDFERKGVKVRLYNYGGDDLWIEADFTDKAGLDEVNRWNMRAKFSRAVLVKGGSSATISLESQVDCTLGITDGMARDFVQRFDGEIQAFVRFLKK
jgi:hypothetical protein